MGFPFNAAIATNQGDRSDAHLMKASTFLIFQINEDGSYTLLGNRRPPSVKNQKKDDVTAERANNRFSEACHCAPTGHRPGGCGHSAETFRPLTETLNDCAYLVCANAGPAAASAFTKAGITFLTADLPIGEIIEKLSLYERRLNTFKRTSDSI